MRYHKTCENIKCAYTFCAGCEPECDNSECVDGDCFCNISDHEDDDECEETCVKCNETKIESWYYNTTPIKNAPVCQDCLDNENTTKISRPIRYGAPSYKLNESIQYIRIYEKLLFKHYENTYGFYTY